MSQFFLSGNVFSLNLTFIWMRDCRNNFSSCASFIPVSTKAIKIVSAFIPLLIKSGHKRFKKGLTFIQVMRKSRVNVSHKLRSDINLPSEI